MQRAISTQAAKALVRATESFRSLRDAIVTLSIDEHAIARFTRKFRIQKGFHTIRNKHMHIEKLFYLHWPTSREFLALVVTRGGKTLGDVVGPLVRYVRARVRPSQLRVVLDAGAAHSHADLCQLDRFHKTVFLVRVPRRPAYTARWKRLPREAFTLREEPGRYVGAKGKEIEIAETTTPIQGVKQPVRTIVVRERAMRGKDRWHALFVLHDATSTPWDLIQEYRTRQQHEQSYRIGVHDLAMDTVPSGYPKKGSPQRPGFRQGPLLLAGWIVALVHRALHELSATLPARFHHAHPRTLRRWILCRPAELLVTPSHLLVVLEPCRWYRWLRQPLQKFNAAEVALSWFGGRRVVMGFAACKERPPDAQPLLPQAPEGGPDPAKGLGGVWC